MRIHPSQPYLMGSPYAFLEWCKTQHPFQFAVFCHPMNEDVDPQKWCQNMDNNPTHILITISFCRTMPDTLFKTVLVSRSQGWLDWLVLHVCENSTSQFPVMPVISTDSMQHREENTVSVWWYCLNTGRRTKGQGECHCRDTNVPEIKLRAHFSCSINVKRPKLRDGSPKPDSSGWHVTLETPFAAESLQLRS